MTAEWSDGSIRSTRMKCCVYYCVVLLFLLTVQAAKKESCERCEQIDNCPFFKTMKNEDQKNWRDRFECEGASSSKPIYGFSSSAKGDLVCCPANIWQVNNPPGLQQKVENKQGLQSTEQPVKVEKNSFIYQPNYNVPGYVGYPSSSTGNQFQGYPNGGGGYGSTLYGSQGGNGNIGPTGTFGSQGLNNQNGRLTNNQFSNGNSNQGLDKSNTGLTGNQNGYQVYENNNENGGLNNNQFGNKPYDKGISSVNGNQFDSPGYNNRNSGAGNHFGNQNEDQGYENGDTDNDESDSDEYGGEYESQRAALSNQRRRKRPNNNIKNPYFLPANRKGNSFRGTNLGGQCPVTSFPPNPDTGCCGQEATNPDRINASPNNPRYTQSSWMPQTNPSYQPPWLPYSDRVKREDVNVTFDNRIAGGKETELEQFPWTVLLKTVFQYPDKDVAFSCGGSLISSRYVLTAGHCVFDAQGSVKDVEVYLAEYDKRTFPRDCKNVLGRGEVCVENKVMHAEKFHLHPEYDDNRLNNDIALIRLRGDAPYTDYIRPICLPPLNVDNPQLSNLRLAVAGWGRNGQYKSNIKQSTVVNLVPQSECRNSYPSLTTLQVCAAGYTGEDTCKGDSGGPLMMLYGGKYFVSGVVSGKRADAPCGTSVPSLYTNVFQYLPWIRRIITN